MEVMVKAYTDYLRTLGFADSTCYDFPRFVADFTTWLQACGVDRIQDLSAGLVWRYFEYLQAAKGKRTQQVFSSSHLNRQFLATDKFLEFLHHNGWQDAPLPTGFQVEHSRKKALQVLSRQEVACLYNTIDLIYYRFQLSYRTTYQLTTKLILDLCYGCGLRKREVYRLRIGDVDFDKRYIHIRQGKNYRDRLVPMTASVCASIQTYVYQYRRELQHKRPGFVYPFHYCVIDSSFRRLVQYCDDSILQNKAPSPHTLRHSIATHLLQGGMNIEQIAHFLGHSTLESTKLYTHIINEQL
ncbi:MAG: tyrosine-type recombinase/integrase [Salibacteraceae bacterium]